MAAGKDQPVVQPTLFPTPSGDLRLLEPGWAGDLAPDELEFLQAELFRDKKLGFQWGFRLSAKRRPEWAIPQVAMWGDSASRTPNMVLTRQQLQVL